MNQILIKKTIFATKRATNFKVLTLKKNAEQVLLFKQDVDYLFI